VDLEVGASVRSLKRDRKLQGFRRSRRARKGGSRLWISSLRGRELWSMLNSLDRWLGWNYQGNRSLVTKLLSSGNKISLKQKAALFLNVKFYKLKSILITSMSRRETSSQSMTMWNIVRSIQKAWKASPPLFSLTLTKTWQEQPHLMTLFMPSYPICKRAIRRR
jgi:hypothetical protein